MENYEKKCVGDLGAGLSRVGGEGIRRAGWVLLGGLPSVTAFYAGAPFFTRAFTSPVWNSNSSEIVASHVEMAQCHRRVWPFKYKLSDAIQ